MARPSTISQRDICGAASDLLDEGGVDGLRMRAVAQRLGVSTMALYRHIRDREDLLELVAARGFTELEQQFETAAHGSDDPEVRLTAILAKFVDLALKQPHLFRLMFADRRQGARVLPGDASASPTLRVVKRVLSDGVRAGRFADNDLDEAALGCAVLAQGLCLARCNGRIGGNEDEFRALADRICARYIVGLRPIST